MKLISGRNGGFYCSRKSIEFCLFHSTKWGKIKFTSDILYSLVWLPSLAAWHHTRWWNERAVGGVKLFGGLLDFPSRPGVSYFLTWLGMKIFIFNTKDALTIFFTQCYLAAIPRSASLPLKHSTIQLVYWAEIVHFLPSSTRMVASFEISLFLFSAHSAPEMHPGWSKSVSWFVPLRCCRPEVTIPSSQVIRGDRNGGSAPLFRQRITIYFIV